MFSNGKKFGTMMRIRITFSKTNHMRYTSHLDLHRTWERTLRRARLPLAYSQGFNPRPKINLAAALPLGFTSECEIMEFWLDSKVDKEIINNHLDETVPPGIEIRSIQEIDLKTPKIPNLVVSAEYEVVLLDPVPNLDQRVTELLDAESLPRERRGKHYDLRPLIEELKVLPKDARNPNSQRIYAQLSLRSGATGRPEETLLELGIDPFSARVHRKSLLLITNH
jgi:radical SAM-linked protein